MSDQPEMARPDQREGEAQDIDGLIVAGLIQQLDALKSRGLPDDVRLVGPLAAFALSSYKQRISELEKGLEEIAKADPVDLALDPEWPQRIARSLISKGETTGVPGFAGRAGGAGAPEPHTRLVSDERSSLTQWQPIETAPKDGSEFLVFIEPDTQMVVFYDEPSADAPSHCWHRVDGLAYHRDLPTHWKPLPPPPSLTQGDEA